MKSDALATTYARSIFEMARDAGARAKIEEVNDELEQLAELTRAVPAFGQFLASPVIGRDRRADVLRGLFDGRITDLTLRFLLVLNEKNRLNKLQAIAEAHDSLVQAEFGRVEVDVFTAAPLGEAAKDVIFNRVQSALGREPVLHLYVEEDMIGGVKLRIGDQLIDGSVRTQLRRLKNSLLESGGWKLREHIHQLIEEDEIS